jgi:hypothetical protein
MMTNNFVHAGNECLIGVRSKKQDDLEKVFDWKSDE